MSSGVENPLSPTPTPALRWTSIRALDSAMEDDTVLLRGALREVKLTGPDMAYVVLEERRRSVVGILIAGVGEVTVETIRFAAGLGRESVVAVEGVVSLEEDPVLEASQKVEIVVRKFCLRKAVSDGPAAPIDVEDELWSEAETVGSKEFCTDEVRSRHLNSKTQPGSPRQECSKSPIPVVCPVQAGKSSTQKRGRGPTLCNDIHAMKPGKRIKVELNAFQQPIGDGALKLSQFLGTIARNGELLPIDLPEWRKMPCSYKESARYKILEKFEMKDGGEKWAMQSLSNKWKEWKHVLCKKYLQKGETDVVFPDDSRVLKEQWKNLVNYWKSDAYKRQSEINTKNRKNVKIKHCSGSKSFARIAHEEREKTGVNLDRAALWMKTHSKNGVPIDDATGAIMAKILEIKSKKPDDTEQAEIISADDVLAQAMGEDRRDRVRGLGFGPKLSDIQGLTYKNVFNSSLARDNQKLSQEIDNMKEMISQLRAEMKQMQEMCIKRHLKDPHKDDLPPAISPHQVLSPVGSQPAPSPEGHAATALLNIATSVPNPTQQDSDAQDKIIPCSILSIGRKTVARGYMMSEDPAKIIGGTPLGPGWCEVIVEIIIDPGAPLFKPYGGMTTIEDAELSSVAWVRHFIEVTKTHSWL